MQSDESLVGVVTSRRNRLSGTSEGVGHRLLFSDCSRKRSPTPKKFPRRKEKITRQDKLDDSGFFSTPDSSRGESKIPVSCSGYRWRQLSPELTCSDSDEFLEDLAVDLPKKRRNAPVKGQIRKVSKKNNKTETVDQKKSQRIVSKRKKSSVESESPVAKKLRSREGIRYVPTTPGASDDAKENFELNIVNEDPLDGRSWGETEEERLQKERRMLADHNSRENDGYLRMVGVEHGCSEEDALTDVSMVDVDMDGLQL